MLAWRGPLHKVCLCCAATTQRDTATGRNREREDLESRRKGCMTEIEVLGAESDNNNNNNNNKKDALPCSCSSIHTDTHIQNKLVIYFPPLPKRDPQASPFLTHLLPTPLNQYCLHSERVCMHPQLHACMSDCMSVWALRRPVCLENSINIFQVSYRNRSTGYISLCRFFLSSFAVSLSLQMLHVLGCLFFFSSSSLPLGHTFVDLLRFLKYHFPSSPLSVTGAEEQIGIGWISLPLCLSLSLSPSS